MPEYRHHVASSLSNLAEILRAPGRPDETERMLRRAVDILDRLSAEYPNIPEYCEDLAGYLSNLGRLMLQEDRLDEALRAYRRSLSLFEQLRSSAPERPDIRSLQAEAEEDLARLLADADDPQPQHLEEAMRLARRAVASDSQDSQHRAAEGVALYRAGRWTEAVAALEEAAKGSPGIPGSDQFILAMAHARAGSTDRARLWYDRGLGAIQDGLARGKRVARLRDEAAALLGPDAATMPNGREAFAPER